MLLPFAVRTGLSAAVQPVMVEKLQTNYRHVLLLCIDYAIGGNLVHHITCNNCLPQIGDTKKMSI